MLESPIHRNETRVIFSKKKTYKNGFTNTESNGFHPGQNGFKFNNNDDVGDDADSELYSDDDDEVFMDGPSINKALASKPLMHPRHRAKVKRRRPNCKCRKTAKPIMCFLLLVISLGSLMVAILYVSNQFSSKSKSSGNSTSKQMPRKSSKNDIFLQGCDDISVEDVWTVGFPKLNTESAIRMVDINEDDVLDVVLGFGTGADGYYVPRIVCDIYFNGTYPCFGGLLALDGLTGKELWRHYSPHEMFGINCNADLDNDGVLDCVCGGRAGAFQAISGKHGRLLWSFDKVSVKNEIMNLYTAQIIPDQNGDGMVDVLAIHGGDPLREPGSKERLAGRIIFFSGRTGDVLSWVEVPDHKESYYSLQMYSWPDGTDIVLFGTGGETHGGSLWAVPLHQLYKGNIQSAKKIYTDPYKGVMTPPVLIDITDDGVEDVVMAMFNSTVMAINGVDFSTIWRYHMEMSESYNTPAAGFYNGDDIPDFMVKFAHGPGYPVYYYSQTTVLDGKSGRPLILPQIKDTIGAQSSPLTISMEDYGNDIFLYWLSDCLGHGGEGGAYQFLNGTNVHEQSRSDYCKLRFKSEGYSKIMAVNRHVAPPGATIYYSLRRKKLEHSLWVNTTEEGLRFIHKNPTKYREYMTSVQRDDGVNDDVDRGVVNDREKSETDDLNSPMEYMLQPLEADSHRTSSKKGQSLPRFRSYGPEMFRNQQLPNENIEHKENYINRRPLPYNSIPEEQDYDYGDSENGDSGTYRKLNHLPRYHTGVGRRLLNDIYMKPTSYRRGRSAFNQINDGKDFIKENRNSHRKYKKRKRKRRHVGPHDQEGIQRLLSTGTLAPTTLPVDHPMYNHSIDLVFATYWFFPAKTRVLLPEDQKCIDEKLKDEAFRFNVDSPYYGLDHDGYKHTITDECLDKSDHDLPDDHTYQSQTSYDPFNIHMGQMTVYRLRLTCKCTDSKKKNHDRFQCARILPYKNQQWRAYMGSHGDSHWIPRQTDE